MDDYFDRLMEKIPGANVAEKKVWFSFIFFCFWSEKSSQKIGMDHSVQEKFDTFIDRQLVSPSLGTVNIRQCKFWVLLTYCF